jgi:hypothetical protein
VRTYSLTILALRAPCCSSCGCTRILLEPRRVCADSAVRRDHSSTGNIKCALPSKAYTPTSLFRPRYGRLRKRLAPAAVLIDPTFASTHRLSPRGSHRWPARSATGGKALVLTVQRQPTHTESVSGLEATSGYCACNGGRCTTCVGSHNCSRLWICADHTLSTPETAQLEAHNHLSRHRRQSHACQYTALFRSFVQKRLLF